MSKGQIVVFDGILYGQIPQQLLRDPNIPHAAKVLYGIYHTFAREKKLKDEPQTFVSQKTVGSYMGLHPDRVGLHAHLLQTEGWLTVSRRGMMKSNIITLHEKRRKREKE